MYKNYCFLEIIPPKNFKDIHTFEDEANVGVTFPEPPGFAMIPLSPPC